MWWLKVTTFILLAISQLFLALSLYHDGRISAYKETIKALERK